MARCKIMINKTVEGIIGGVFPPIPNKNDI